MTYERVLINHRNCLVGEPPIQEINFCDLTPGDKVIKIGCGSKYGKQTSSSRFQIFDVPVIYKGIYSLDNMTWLAFEFPFNYCQGFDLFNPRKRVFAVYHFDNGELYQYPINSILIYKPVFEKA